MEWAQFAILIVTLGILFIWNRSESRSDMRHVDSKTEETSKLITAVHITSQQEMKDFHGRLCALEERHNKNIENLLNKLLEVRNKK